MSAIGAALLLAGFAACARSEEPDAARDPQADAGPVTEDAADASDGDVHDSSAPPDATDSAAADGGPCTIDWCETPLPIPDGGKLTLTNVWVRAKGDAWAVSEEGLVLRWNGTAWSVVWDATTPLFGVWGDPEGSIWVVGSGGAIFRGTDGMNWTPIPSGTTTDLLGICEGARDEAHTRNISIVGLASTVLRWDGATDLDGNPSWQTSTLGVTDELYAVSCSGFEVWLAGASTDWFEGGGVLYRDRGAGWELQSALTDSRFELYSSVWAYDPDHVWARGKGYILHSAPSDDGGAPTWRGALSSMAITGKKPSGIWGSSPNDVWIVSSRGRIHHWDGSGITITATAKGWDVLNSNLHGVSGSGPDDVWVVGDNVALHRNVNGQP